MQSLPASALQGLNTLDLPAAGADIRLVGDPEELRDHLLGLDADARHAAQIAGELSNTVLGGAIEGPLLLYRDGPIGAIERSAGGVRVRAPGSCRFDALVEALCAEGVPGIELLSGIPGTVGAAIVQNIAAYGQRISDRFVAASALDLDRGAVVTLDTAALAFGYRQSALKTAAGYTPRLVILDVLLDFPADAPLSPLSYKELASQHAERGRSPDSRAAGDLAGRRATVLEVRDRKGMVVGGAHWVPSAGSFFLSPVVPAEAALRLATLVRGSAFADGFFGWYRPDAASTRFPAALVMRAAGFMNGDRWGEVGLSPHHILALRTHPGAAGRDIAGLSRLVQARIRERFGIALEPEVRFLGDAGDEGLPGFLARSPFTPGEGEPGWARGLGIPEAAASG